VEDIELCRMRQILLMLFVSVAGYVVWAVLLVSVEEVKMPYDSHE
jgi:hypothetical protein